MASGFFLGGVADRRAQRNQEQIQSRGLDLAESRFAFQQSQAEAEQRAARKQDLTKQLTALGDVAAQIKSNFNGPGTDPNLARGLTPLLEQATEMVRLAGAAGFDLEPVFTQIQAAVDGTPTMLEQAEAEAAAESTRLEGTRDARVSDAREIAEVQAGAQSRAALSTHIAKLEADFQDAKRRVDAGLKSPEGGLSSKDKIDIENKLRDDFVSNTKEHVKVADAYGRVQATKPTAAGDLAMIFNYMKMLDPGSVVREGEFATAQNTAGVPDRIRARYNNALRGERLTDTQRQEFKAQAADIWEVSREAYLGLAERYEMLAGDAGVDSRAVVIPLVKEGLIGPADSAGASQGGVTVTDEGVILDAEGNELGRVE